jgi:hypothetical protein
MTTDEPNSPSDELLLRLLKATAPGEAGSEAQERRTRRFEARLRQVREDPSEAARIEALAHATLDGAHDVSTEQVPMVESVDHRDVATDSVGRATAARKRAQRSSGSFGSVAVIESELPSSSGGVTRTDDLDDFAITIADQVESFLVAVRAVARGEADDSAVSMLLLEVSQLLLAGGRLGAIAEVTREEGFEEDPGPDPDLDELRDQLAVLLDPCDVYREVFDPLAVPTEVETRRISDDLAAIVAELAHGLTHFRAGRETEALWWWQFSYLSGWGPAASAALRALHSIVAGFRLQSG